MAFSKLNDIVAPLVMIDLTLDIIREAGLVEDLLTEDVAASTGKNLLMLAFDPAITNRFGWHSCSIGATKTAIDS